MVEPVFEVYHKDRPEVPSVEATISGAVTFNPTAIEPDDQIEGWDALTEFLEETEEEELVDHPEHGETEVTLNQYRWVEVGVESAPVHEFCSECDASVQTNSPERLEDKRYTHHIGTGH